MVGTFDVENYGDLLFPLIAKAAFERRGQPVQIRPFSPNSRLERSWPFRVDSTKQFPESVAELSAVLIGGGQIIRFDKEYPIPHDPAIDTPIAYWLIPAVLAALGGKPVVWNAVGAWTDSPAAPWYDDAVNKVFSASYLVTVRDLASQRHLAKTAPGVDIRLLPDTAFSLSRLWPLGPESKAYTIWRKGFAFAGRYAVIQANHAFREYRSEIEAVMKLMPDCTFVILPICWYAGDRAAGFPYFSGRVAASAPWLSPLLLSEIIARAEFVIASSLHACITALSYGVPAARIPGVNASDRKFELLNEFEGVARIDDQEAIKSLVQRGRSVEPRVAACADQLDRYWDTLTELVRQPQVYDPGPSVALMLGWAANVFRDIEYTGMARASQAQREELTGVANREGSND